MATLLISRGTPYSFPLYDKSKKLFGVKRDLTAADKVIGANFPFFAPVATQSLAPTIISGPVKSVALSTASFKASKLEKVFTVIL